MPAIAGAVATEDVRRISRRLRDLCEPIAGSVYFAPEAVSRYEELGLDYAAGYFCSRGGCLGRAPGEVITAAFGVFNPAIVLPAVERGWAATDPETVLQARLDGATAALRRMLGDVDPSFAVKTLRPVLESAEYAGRMLFSGLRSLAFPDDPVGQLWRVCDYVREHRGDGHIAAWVSHGVDPVEVTLLTELFWGMPLGSYVQTRGWPAEEVEPAIARLEEKGYIRDRAFTDEGRAFRRAIEAATDAMEADVVHALGDEVEDLFAILEPWTKAVLDAGGYPVDPSQTMGRDSG